MRRYHRTVHSLEFLWCTPTQRRQGVFLNNVCNVVPSGPFFRASLVELAEIRPSLFQTGFRYALLGGLTCPGMQVDQFATTREGVCLVLLNSPPSVIHDVPSREAHPFTRSSARVYVTLLVVLPWVLFFCGDGSVGY